MEQMQSCAESVVLLKNEKSGDGEKKLQLSEIWQILFMKTGIQKKRR